MIATQGMVFKSDTTNGIKQYTGVALQPWQQIFYEDWGSLAVGAACGEVYTSMHGGVYRYSGTPNRWYRIRDFAGVKEIAAYGKDVYARDSDCTVIKWTGVPNQWDIMDSGKKAVEITVGVRGLCQIHGNGPIFQFIGTPFNGWEMLPPRQLLPATSRTSCIGMVRFGDI